MTEIDDFEHEFIDFGKKPKRYARAASVNRRGQQAGVNSKLVKKAIEKERKDNESRAKP